jgi:hypothetical protein
MRLLNLAKALVPLNWRRVGKELTSITFLLRQPKFFSEANFAQPRSELGTRPLPARIATRSTALFAWAR